MCDLPNSLWNPYVQSTDDLLAMDNYHWGSSLPPERFVPLNHDNGTTSGHRPECPQLHPKVSKTSKNASSHKAQASYLDVEEEEKSKAYMRKENDAAPSFSPSLYATSSDLRTPPQPKLHHPFRRRDRPTPLESESESEREGRQGESPYPKLIYRALMDAPGHQMVLKDIYKWIARNTDKARDPAFKGWQNNVRHTLSINGVLVAIHECAICPDTDQDPGL